MDALLERLEERVGLSRADLLGLAIALAGCVAATLVALRVPLLAQLGEAGAGTTGTAAAEAPSGAAVPTAGPVLVHVTGAVRRPGVVQLAAGDRVADALEAAGGALPGAALTALNLARPVVDGEQVRVPDEDGASPAGGTAAASADPRLPDGRLDLNRAGAADLEELPGVGPVLAGRIVAHRDEHGPFTDAAELRAVSGIGEATWASLRDLVGVP